MAASNKYKCTQNTHKIHMVCITYIQQITLTNLPFQSPPTTIHTCTVQSIKKKTHSIQIICLYYTAISDATYRCILKYFYL
jgi:hypothetical protein